MDAKARTYSGFEKVGAPLFSIVPKEGSMIEPGAGTVSVINRGPHPNAVRVFINWLISKEGRNFYAEVAGIESLRKAIYVKAHS